MLTVENHLLAPVLHQQMRMPIRLRNAIGVGRLGASHGHGQLRSDRAAVNHLVACREAKRFRPALLVAHRPYASGPRSCQRRFQPLQNQTAA